MRLSFRGRLSLWHTVTVSSVLAVAAWAGNWALARAVLGQVDGALVALAETETASLQADPLGRVGVHEVTPGSSPPSFVRLDRFVQIVDLDGRVVAASSNLGTARLPVGLPMLGRLRAGEIVFETHHDFGDEPIRLVAIPITLRQGRFAVEVAGSLDDAHAVLRTGRWLFLGLSLVILGAMGATSILFARRAARPIDEVVAQARQIGDSNLAGRLPHPGGQDELARLVETLNAMLARIERGVESQKRFTADASHELRSPLSRLRSELEVTLRRPRDATEYEESLRSCLEEVVRLSHLTEELLTLARLDADGQAGRAPAAVPVADILTGSLRQLDSQASRRGVSFVVEPDPPACSVKVNPTAVGLALTNVIENAVKFSPAGGQVRVGLCADGPDIVIQVSDAGPGIDPRELPRLFDRFHRGAMARARATEAPGFGLGLAISRAAIEREGGRLSAENRSEGGARFIIRLPPAG